MATKQKTDKEPFPGTRERAVLEGNTAADLPEDNTLSGLVAIRRLGLAAAIPALGIPSEAEVELKVLGHKPGHRATLLAVDGSRCLILRIGSTHAAEEAALHRAFADAGLAGDTGDRVPRLVHFEPQLEILVTGCLEGVEAAHMLRHGGAERAGEMAARWLRRMVTLPVSLGEPMHPDRLLARAFKWVAALGAADSGLGKAAAAAAGALMKGPPPTQAPRLVHGTFHDRNVLDLGDSVGVIDWTRFAQGPIEFDAGTYLASISRVGLEEKWAPDAAVAERAFLGGISEFANYRAVAWYRGTALLALADRVLSKKRGDWLLRAHALVSMATTFALFVE